MKFPATFVQIHYHNRRGGVTTVMKQYARTFSSVASAHRFRNIVICERAGGELGDVAEIQNVHGCGYAQWKSRDAFCRARNRLVEHLERILTDSSLPRPICVTGHNLSLGKNIALSSAFAEVARHHRGDPEFSFFSVIHDFAEEGRSGQMARIRRAQSWRWPVWDDLYPAKAGVIFATVGRRNYTILKSAGLPVRLLLNPLEPPPEGVALSAQLRRRIEKGLACIAQSDGTVFDAQKPSVVYPVRCIARKNVVEAIIWYCKVRGMNLIIGLPGTSPSDKHLYIRLKSICRAHRLPVIFDYERLTGHLPAGMNTRRRVLALMYAYCRFAVSTSIAEGFGYAIFEPWLFRRPVLGRKPLGFTPAAGIFLEYLYDRFDIPVRWISMSQLTDAYRRRMAVHGTDATMRSGKSFQARLRKAFVRSGRIDFGVCDMPRQFAVLQRVLTTPGALHEICLLNGRRLIKQENLFALHSRQARDRIEKNRAAIARQFGLSRFEKLFRRCFASRQETYGKKARPEMIARLFVSPARFRLLMGP